MSEKLNLKWDHEASKSIKESKRDMSQQEKVDVEPYLEFLEEMRSYRCTVKKIKKYSKRFTL
ncbi:MAG: hypothetical protein ACOCSE_05165 [Chitinivibrionales bacterium]